MSKSISPDTIIGHYRVVSQIGAGGMGEVYLVEDSRLHRKPTSDPRTFVMRSTGTFAFYAFGELLTFDVGPDGQVTGYHTPNLRYTLDRSSRER